jgi:aspartyl-tRNA(Asn)/glutamyl-tRNA(Gln) amidotransferase subunit A
LPASYCGVYGLKPTYGTLSRYGLVAFGSSLDQIGLLGRSPDDLALVLSVVAGKDPRDATSQHTDFGNAFPLRTADLGKLHVGVPEQLLGDAVEPAVRERFDEFVAWLESSGAKVDSCSLPLLDACIALYYIIAPAEASSNLARFDGVRYGYRTERWHDLDEMYELTRDEGFGPEVKRRILVGNFVLSSGYYDAYYKKAQEVRALLRANVDEELRRFDFLLSPTSPTLPFKLGEKVDDPLAMYMTDLCTTFANLTGLPAISLPVGTANGSLPVGVQLVGPRFSEAQLLPVCKAWHEDDGG